MSFKIIKTINKMHHIFGRKHHNRLQRDIIEDMYAYELSFEDWNQIDTNDCENDMDVSYDNDMMDYENYMTPILEVMDESDESDESDSEVSYPWMDTICETEFLFTKTRYSWWIVTSMKYDIPDDVAKTFAMLEWLQTQGGVYSLLLNGSRVIPQNILHELKRSVFWSYMFLTLASGLQIRVNPNYMRKFGLHFNGIQYYPVDGCLDVYSRAYEGCMKLLKIAQQRYGVIRV